MHIGEDRREEPRQWVPAGQSKQVKRANQATNDGEHGQDDKRYGHDRRGLVNREAPCCMLRWLFFLVLLVASSTCTAIIAREDAIEKAEHVKCRQTCRDDTDTPEQVRYRLVIS